MATAEKLFVESIKIAEDIYKPLDLTYSYSSLGLLRLAQDNIKEAEALFLQSLELRQEIGQLEGVLWALEGLAVIALKQGKYARAQEIMQEAQSLRHDISAPVLPHTLKYILPELLSFQKSDRLTPRRLDKFKGKNPAIESVNSISSKLIDQAVSFGMDVGISLSEREREVLNLVAQGHSNNQIAKLLVISPGTVNNHLSSIYSKLGVNSRTAALRYALDHNML
jgi:DNA-binding CsgD family transcriptional regulator